MAAYPDDPNPHVHCYSCGFHQSLKAAGGVENLEPYFDENFDIQTMNTITDHVTLSIPERKISEATARFYGVQTGVGPDARPLTHSYPCYARGDSPAKIGSFVRTLPKSFHSELPQGTTNLGLFGAEKFPRGSAKYITVTEGHLDALAAYEMLGSKWPVVSIHMGADAAEKEFKRNLEYLESFDAIYICFDRDASGQRAALACAQVLSPGKARIVALDPVLKDPCNYRIEGKAEAFQKTWWNATIYTPAGILNGDQVADRIKNREIKKGIPYPFEGLNKLTYGIRTSELVVIKAPTGVGKTSVLREIERSILEHDKDCRIGTLFLEETPEDSGLGLMSVHAGVPFHLPDAVYTPEQYTNAERILRENRVYFYDAFGSNKIDEIIARVRYYAKGLGCKYIVLDHLSIIVSDQMQGDERKLLDSITTRLKTLTMELDVGLICVVHENRQGQIRGTAAIEQLANIVLELDREMMSPDPVVRRMLHIGVPKNRFSGRTGPACSALYDEDTGRLTEYSNEAQPPSAEEVDAVFGHVDIQGG